MNCGSSCEHEGAAILFIPFFIIKAPPLTAPLFNVESSRKSVEEDMLTPYKQVFNHMFETYATDHIIVEMDTEIVRFTWPTNLSPLQYAETL